MKKMENKKIEKLAQLFAKFRIYSNRCYNDGSPVEIFQKMFLDDHYGWDLKTFLALQNYEPEQRGADLPWWGSKYFTGESGRKVMIISQDSLAEDAGSVVFWACLYPVIGTEDHYRKFTQKLGSKKPFAFKSWETILKQLLDWKIDLQFCYITDASKVYKKKTWKDRDFDSQKSKELLEAEIEFCNPDMVILLGASPLSLVAPDKNYADAVDAGQPLRLMDKKFIVAPFFIGQGPIGNRSGKGFKKRLDMATNLIKS